MTNRRQPADMILRTIEREESFQDRHNLTPEQNMWEDGYQLIRPVLFTNKPAPIVHMVWAFVPAAGTSLAQPIVRAESVRMRFLHPIPSQHWRGGDRRRTHRLHFAEGQISHDDGQLVVRTSVPGTHLETADVGKAPMQDHYRFDLLEFDPRSLIPTTAELSAPCEGTFAIQRTDMHLSLLISNVPVYRFLLDHGKFETHADDPTLAADGAHVKRGDLLVRLTARVQYGKLRFTHQRPDKDLIGGDVITASRKPERLRLAAAMLYQLGAAATDQEAPGFLQVVSPGTWLPQALAAMSHETFQQLTAEPGWTVNPALSTAIRRAVSHGGDLFIRSPFDTPVTYVRTEAGLPVADASVDSSLVVAGVAALTQVKGLGNAKAQQLAEGLNVATVEDLVTACECNEVQKLRGFSAKTEARLLEAACAVLADRDEAASAPVPDVQTGTDTFLVFHDGTKEVKLAVPASCVVLADVAAGAVVEPEDPFADWCPRANYSEWDAVTATCTDVSALVTAFLSQNAVVAGIGGYQGDEVLVPTVYLPQGLATKPTGYYLDFSEASPYVDEKTGAVIGPAIHNDDWRRLTRTYAGVQYDWTPAGDRMSDHPIVATERRRDHQQHGRRKQFN